jgi:hypothetical protein
MLFLLFTLLFLLLFFLPPLLLILLLLLLLDGTEPRRPQRPPHDSRDLGPFVYDAVACRSRAIPKIITDSGRVALSPSLGDSVAPSWS